MIPIFFFPLFTQSTHENLSHFSTIELRRRRGCADRLRFKCRLANANERSNREAAERMWWIYDEKSRLNVES